MARNSLRFPQYAPYLCYADLEDPLLRAIAKRHGAIWFSLQGGQSNMNLLTTSDYHRR